MEKVVKSVCYQIEIEMQIGIDLHTIICSIFHTRVLSTQP